jgi:hypothetical protein
MRVVNTGMNNLTVPAACLLPEAGIFFDNEHALKLCGELLRYGQADYSGADYRNIEGVDAAH